MARLNKETLLDWYRQMVLIREFEETCQQLYNEKRITGVYLHLYSGHEAVGVGAIANMEIGKDHIITAYRDHGIALALGVDPNRVMAEMMGRVDGVSGGKGGSMHLASLNHHFWGGYAIVGGHLPLASGIALEAKYNETGAFVICFVGDGATNNGYFHEAVNIAGVWDLPVIWIIENNGFGMGTETSRAAGNPILHERANSYGVKDLGRVDGQDVMAMYEKVNEAAQHVWSGGGSAMIEAITYRYRGHGVSDKQYDTRFSEELEEWKQNKDPITVFRRQLEEKYKDIGSELDDIEAAQREIVAKSVEFAENSPFPDTLEQLYANVYVEES
ncbi:pyruvate dehydrogenase (acetyl-transferring) E1 component subunit alpha [Phototrophicus methaneseepsis]|uniref:Pyruvate dehydrogenase (Acetyl-transferring) E1 component subunit alpha n=1 Tax=Phototrophicus methaneseepsis TaxID=2710758 RepID=A0A7S8E926_9CHLR|nr:thiamine pyrophosphate-dependent enzyme [Phototrophicus methaneseepsis]QPC82489.1 pyruvate dehydrogenase (acetyl-transferring) E1 component subunit alpha [Phototrophicus methaneseepsis]